MEPQEQDTLASENTVNVVVSQGKSLMNEEKPAEDNSSANDSIEIKPEENNQEEKAEEKPSESQEKASEEKVDADKKESKRKSKKKGE